MCAINSFCCGKLSSAMKLRSGKDTTRHLEYLQVVLGNCNIQLSGKAAYYPRGLRLQVSRDMSGHALRRMVARRIQIPQCALRLSAGFPRTAITGAASLLELGVTQNAIVIPFVSLGALSA